MSCGEVVDQEDGDPEQAALGLASKGLPVVIVNPSAPIGPRDVEPTHTRQVIVDLLNRALPTYPEPGLNWVQLTPELERLLDERQTSQRSSAMSPRKRAWKKSVEMKP